MPWHDPAEKLFDPGPADPPMASVDSLGRLLRDLYQVAVAYPINEFSAHALALVHEHIPFDSAWMGRSTLTAMGPVLHTSHLHGLPDDYIAAWERVRHCDPLVPMVAEVPGRPGLLSIADNRMAPEFRDFMARYGFATIMCTIAVDSPVKTCTHLSLYRHSFVPPFSEREIELARNLLPNLASAITINQIRQIDQMRLSSSPVRTAVAICSPLGVIQYADPGFSEFMLMEWPDWSGAVLPEQLRLADPGAGVFNFVGTHITLALERTAETTIASARSRSPIHVLTPREQVVARLFGEGHTYKAVAKRLGLSPATVRHHLRQVYAKLKVQNKGEIAWLLCQEPEGPITG